MSSEALESALERSRASLELIGDGDWTPQDSVHASLCKAAEAALAVAREREQRLREGLAAVLRQLDRLLPGFVTGEVSEAKALARAALADEPAAATLAEPEQGPRHSARTALDPAACEAPVPASPGSASAAADEPACPDCGMTAQVAPSRKEPGRWMCHGCARVFDAAADEPGETPA